MDRRSAEILARLRTRHSDEDLTALFAVIRTEPDVSLLKRTSSGRTTDAAGDPVRSAVDRAFAPVVARAEEKAALVLDSFEAMFRPSGVKLQTLTKTLRALTKAHGQSRVLQAVEALRVRLAAYSSTEGVT
jgi:hypothetical protein